ncbi:hypothetical protein ACWD4B_13140 [Streptomyces sp. NPDC002536]
MNRSGIKRAKLRALLAAAVATVALTPIAGVSVAQAQENTALHPVKAAEDSSRISPVGKWTLQVHFEGESYNSAVQFTQGGKAFFVYGGAGTWTQTGANRFTFHVAEPMWDKNGNYLGWVDVDQTAVIDGSTFTSTGVSRQYDQNDRLTRAVQVEDTGTRV